MNQERLMTILLEPRVTEKSTLIGEAYNQYVFKQDISKLIHVNIKSIKIFYKSCEITRTITKML